MTPRIASRLLLLVLFAGLLGGGTCTWSFHSGDDDDDDNTTGTTTMATFGGADLAARLADLPGVLHADAGWDGNGPLGPWFVPFTDQPATRVQFDASRLSFADLLAAARVRADEPVVTLLARDARQAGEARADWPAGAGPALEVRLAHQFTPRR